MHSSDLVRNVRLFRQVIVFHQLVQSRILIFVKSQAHSLKLIFIIGVLLPILLILLLRGPSRRVDLQHPLREQLFRIALRLKLSCFVRSRLEQFGLTSLLVLVALSHQSTLTLLGSLVTSLQTRRRAVATGGSISG